MLADFSAWRVNAQRCNQPCKTTPQRAFFFPKREVSDKLQFSSPEHTCHGGRRAAVPTPGSFAQTSNPFLYEPLNVTGEKPKESPKNNQRKRYGGKIL